MTVHSGKFGAVDTVSTLRSFTLSEVLNLNAHTTSNTRAGKNRSKGIRSWSGQILGWGSQPSVMPGETLAFVGYGAPDSGVYNTVGQRYSGNVMITQAQIVFNFESGEPIGYTLDFVGQLALTKTAAAAAIVDSTAPDIPEICAASLEYFNVSDQLITDVTQATLTITSDVKTFANSSTVVSGTCWQNAIAGPIDWNLTWTRQSELAALEPGAQHVFKVNDTASTLWTLTEGIVGDMSNIQVDVDTGNIISHQQTAYMQANPGTLGSITMPDTTTFWP